MKRRRFSPASDMPGARTRRRPAVLFLLMMSIAVSALVKPSRCLRLALVVYAGLNLAAGLALASGLSAGASGRDLLPLAAGGVCALAAWLAWSASMGLVATRAIDISGLGEIRLTVQQSLGAVPARLDVLQLLPGSTIWPHCLLLRLASQGGPAVTVLVILPDSVDRAQFRALSVAFKAIAGRDNKFFGNNKIL